MEHVLSYASPFRRRHWSRTALAGMLAGGLCGPLVLCAWWCFDHLPGDGSVTGLLGLILFLLLPFIAFITSVAGFGRAWSTETPYVGLSMASLGFAGAIAWPLGIAWYVVSHINWCC